MIEIIPFNNKIHFESLKSLHKAQKSSSEQFITSDNLPKIGFVANKRAQNIAMGFLRQVEGGYAQIDTLVSNPEASQKDRNKAIDKVVTKLIDTAKSLKIKGILAITTEQCIIDRSEKYNFHVLPHFVIAREF